MIELKFGKKFLKILIFNIVINQTSTFKSKKRFHFIETELKGERQ